MKENKWAILKKKQAENIAKLPDNLVEEIYKLCLKCKIDWFYQDYYKKKRRTIKKDDISDIYFNILDLGLDMSEELHQWFKVNLN